MQKAVTEAASTATVTSTGPDVTCSSAAATEFVKCKQSNIATEVGFAAAFAVSFCTAVLLAFLLFTTRRANRTLNAQRTLHAQPQSQGVERDDGWAALDTKAYELSRRSPHELLAQLEPQELSHSNMATRPELPERTK